MTFEVGQVDHEVVVGQVAAHDVVFQVLAVLDGNAYLVVFVHDINGKDGIESVFMDGLPMFRHVLSAAAVGRAAFHDGAVDALHEVADECGFEVVGVASFAGRYLHGHAAFGLHAQGLVDLDERLRGDVACEIDFALCLRAHRREDEGQRQDDFSHIA